MYDMRAFYGASTILGCPKPTPFSVFFPVFWKFFFSKMSKALTFFEKELEDFKHYTG